MDGFPFTQMADALFEHVRARHEGMNEGQELVLSDDNHTYAKSIADKFELDMWFRVNAVKKILSLSRKEIEERMWLKQRSLEIEQLYLPPSDNLTMEHTADKMSENISSGKVAIDLQYLIRLSFLEGLGTPEEIFKDINNALKNPQISIGSSIHQAIDILISLLKSYINSRYYNAQNSSDPVLHPLVKYLKSGIQPMDISS